FICLAAAHHDDRTIPQRRLAIHEPLISRGRSAAHDADRLELVDDLGDAHEGGHRTERKTPEIDVGPGQNHADPRVGEPVGDVYDAVVQELRFVHGDDFGVVAKPAGYLVGGINWLGFDSDAVV